MSTYFYFTDPTSCNNKEAYGPSKNIYVPEKGADCEQFLVTSMHSGGKSPAFAVCKSILFVQQQIDNSNLLNIILKPLVQPPFEFPKIKYFIYKGIRKDSLVNTGEGDYLLQNNDCELLEHIWSSYKNQGGEAPHADIIGLSSYFNKLHDDVTLDEVFADTKQPDQLPIVQAGWNIGMFGETFGFEIMFESLGFKPTLTHARNFKNFIQAKIYTGSSQAEFFEHWHDKEAILNYVDPAAFFGSFINDKLNVIQGGTRYRYKYKELFENVINKQFENRNKCYIDIRNEFNFSLNYFKNYGNSPTDNTTDIMIGCNNAPIPLNYYRNAWLILILDNSDFVNTPTMGRNIVTMQLKDINNDNPLPLVYFKKAYDNTFAFPNEKVNQYKFLPLTKNGNDTEEFSFAFPNSNSSGVELISSYAQLRFCKRFDVNNPPAISSGTTIRSLTNDNYDVQFKYTDFVSANVSGFTIETTNEEFYSDADVNRGINLLGRSEDTNGKVFFSILKNPYKPFYKKNKLLESIFSKKIWNVFDFLKSEKSSLNIRTIPLTINGVQESVLDIQDFGKNTLFASTDINEFQCLYLDNNKLTLLQNQIAALPTSNSIDLNYPLYFGTRFLNNGLAADNTPYVQSEVIVTGYVNTSSVISVTSINTGIMVYRTAIDYEVDQENFKQSFSIVPLTSGFSIIQSGNTYTIQSILYLVRGSGVTINEMNLLRDIIEENIKQVWDTTTNRAMSRIYNGMPVTISSANIQVIFTAPPSILQQDENAILVQHGIARSFIYGNKRAGIFFINPNPSNTAPLRGVDLIAENVPAHEFGHILGLADRYLPVIKATISNINALINNKEKRFAFSAPMYLPASYDPQYSSNFMWIHNIMSTYIPIHQNTSTRSFWEKKSVIDENIKKIEIMPPYINAVHGMRSVVNNNFITGYSSVGIHISEHQISHIINQQTESSNLLNKVVIYDNSTLSGPRNRFTGTFAGLDRNTNTAVMDKTELETPTTLQLRITMEQRTYMLEPATQRQSIADWHALYDGNNPLEQNDNPNFGQWLNCGSESNFTTIQNSSGWIGFLNDDYSSIGTFGGFGLRIWNNPSRPAPFRGYNVYEHRPIILLSL